MVCYNDPGLFPFVTCAKIMTIPVIGTFFGPARICIRADVLPDRSPVRTVFFPVSAFCLRGPADYFLVFSLLILFIGPERVHSPKTKIVAPAFCYGIIKLLQ